MLASFPVIRTDPDLSARITWRDCLVGYLVIVLVVPGVAWVLRLLLVGAPGDGAPPDPAVRMDPGLLDLFILSQNVSWIGALMSIPFVVFARNRGLFGWGSAFVVGGIVEIFVLGFGLRMPLEGLVLLLWPSGLLGVFFWATIRILRPSAFRPQGGAGS